MVESTVGMSIALIRGKSTKTAVRRIVEAALAETLGTKLWAISPRQTASPGKLGAVVI
jgi:hypothetical protein